MTATMTEPQAAGNRSRRNRRLVLIAAAAVVVIAVVVLVVVLGNRGANTSAGPSTPTSAPVSPSTSQPATTNSSSASAPAGALADGCLGGPDPFAAILPAQTQATRDDLGAAALARTFGRWSVTYPIDPNAAEVLATIVTPGNPFQQGALESLNQLARQLQAQGYTESRVLPDQGAYRISPTSTDTHVDLDLILYRQLTRNDGRTEEMRMAISMLLDRTPDGPWSISGTLPPLGPDPFAASPTVPWLAFEGAC